MRKFILINKFMNNQINLEKPTKTSMDYRGLILGFLAVYALAIGGALFYFIGMVLGSMYVNSLKGKLSKENLNRRVWLFIVLLLLTGTITNQAF
jgi:hypothetical protein